MAIPSELTAKPSLRGIWQDAKKDAASKAKSAKKEKAFKTLQKEIGKKNLGPNLDNWVKAYPNWPKMEDMEKEISDIIDEYKKSLEECKKDIDKGELDLSEDIPELLISTLDSIEDKLESLADIAEKAIASDVTLGEKASKKIAKNVKKLTPIVVLQHPDISRILKDKLKDDLDILQLGKFEVEVILGDESVLSKMTETPNLREKVALAANFSLLVDNIGGILKSAVAKTRKDPDKADKFENEAAAAIDLEVKEATKRAAVEVLRITKVRTKYRNYKIKSTINVTFLVAGIAGGVASLALAPFTMGASVVIGCLSLAKAAVTLGETLGKLSLEAEEMINLVAYDLTELYKKYKEASSGRIGAEEVGRTFVNATLPSLFGTIKKTSGDCDQITDKINGIEVNAEDTSLNLNEMLEKQEEAIKNLTEFEKNNKEVLSKEEIKNITKLIKEIEKSQSSVDQSIKSVIKLNERVKVATNQHDKLSKALKILAAKEPTWAKVTEMIIENVAAIGFVVAGSAITPGPDAYKFAEVAKNIIGHTGTALGALETSKNIVESTKDAIETKFK